MPLLFAHLAKRMGKSWGAAVVHSHRGSASPPPAAHVGRTTLEIGADLRRGLLGGAPSRRAAKQRPADVACPRSPSPHLPGRAVSGPSAGLCQVGRKEFL
jgi:hypothetical protein